MKLSDVNDFGWVLEEAGRKEINLSPQYDLPDLPRYHLPELLGRRGKQNSQRPERFNLDC